MNLETIIKEHIRTAVETLYQQAIEDKLISLQCTRKEFKGDITLVVFPLVKLSKKNPEQTANELGEYLKTHVVEVDGFNVVKGFLNLEISTKFWLEFLSYTSQNQDFGTKKATENSPSMMVEYSSPNTNKPLHLGHVRNNLLGYSVAEILKANGNQVTKVNLVNDRGIHICKSMLAWQKFGNGETPASSGKKGDHLVGEYYVKYSQEQENQIKEMIARGVSEDEAKKTAPILLEAQEMLRQWEDKNPEVIQLWETMNGWVYEGFNETYKQLGVDFDRFYYESQTYLLGKTIVAEGLEKNVFIKKEDGSVRIDLTPDGLDEKVLLRSDGTSVYMTQDLGTAHQRQEEYHFDKMVYVVGNEQDYHFKVLILVLEKLGYDWAKNLFHLSYGMVELPEGKMKSREGKVVDADDLVAEMISTSREMSQKLGKLEGYSEEEAEKVYYMIAMGALKYFLLRVDPKKKMMFNPAESIDFNGNTGPFIQYSYARIQSILRKAKEQSISITNIDNSLIISEKELGLLRMIHEFPKTIKDAGDNYSPALVANFVYDLAKEYNQFYHDCSILKEENVAVRNLRLVLSSTVANCIKTAMKLLGIDVPERM